MGSSILIVRAASNRASLVQGVHQKYEAEFNALHMNWVLVDDAKGNSRAQIRWVVDP